MLFCLMKRAVRSHQLIQFIIVSGGTHNTSDRCRQEEKREREEKERRQSGGRADGRHDPQPASAGLMDPDVCTGVSDKDQRNELRQDYEARFEAHWQT